MGNLQQLRGIPVSATASGTSTCIATLSGTTGVTYYVTDIAVSGDSAAGIASVLAGATGTTTVWAMRLSNATTFSEQLSSPIKGITGQSVSVQMTGTNVCYANISGYSITT